MLFGGETITQNADVVMFVHREEIVHAKFEPSMNAEAKKEGGKTPWTIWKEKMDLIAGKAVVYNNKRRGAQGNKQAELVFEGDVMTFRDVS